MMRERDTTRLVTRPRTIHLVQLTDSEVQDLASIGNAKVVSVALASFFFGVFSNLVLASITSSPRNPYVLAGLLAGAALSFTVGTVFAVSAARSFARSSQKLREYLSREDGTGQDRADVRRNP